MIERTPSELRRWAESVIAEHAVAVARAIGLSDPPTDVRVEIDRPGPGPGWTTDATIHLGERWFAEHPDDVGCVLHELAHAYMRAPDQPDAPWLIEGIADYVRDVLRHDASWTMAHHRQGSATAGYQTTAHFLLWLEAREPGSVAELSRRLSAGTYDEETFVEITERPLSVLVATYEAEQGAS